MKIEIPYTRIFEENLKAKTQIVVNRGGARSSKSYSICQLFLNRFLEEKRKKFLIIRKTFPALRISTFILWNELINLYRVGNRIHQERQVWNYYYNGNLLHFGSLDDPEKIKSTDWNYIWAEEANEFTYEDFQILKLRLSTPQDNGRINQIFLSFNPIDAFHWIKTKVIDQEKDVTEIVSTYKDNPFLSDEYIKTIEALKNQSPNHWRIYGLGEWGRLENLIYTNWDEVMTMPSDGDEFYGLDFGFNNPTVLLRMIKKDNEIWEEEKIYQTNLTTPQLIERLKEEIPEEKRRRCPIYADPEDPKAIEEIFMAGFNIHPADNRVKEGIDFVQRHKIHIHHQSSNLIKEKRAYSWKKDKAGNIIDAPIKFLDHAMDAERYAIFTHLNKVMPGFFIIGKRGRKEEKEEERTQRATL